MLQSLGVDAIGVNCSTGPAEMIALVEKMAEYSTVPLIAKPNAGLPELEDGKTVYKMTPDMFADAMRGLVEAGASIVGGCCGTTPEHISAMVRACRGCTVVPPPAHRHTLAASYTHTAELGRAPLIIGERLNPTGKKALKEALRRNDMDYLCREALAQADAGAQILDLNVGLPEIDEPDMLCRAVQAVQAVCDLPLQLDTSDPVALEMCIRDRPSSV